MKTMKRKFLTVFLTLMALLICLVSLAGCGGNSIVGKYVNPDNSQSYYELQEDNKWTDGTLSGTYTLEDGKLTLRQGETVLAEGTLSEGTMTVNGKTYKYQSSGNFFTKYGLYIILAVVVVLLIVWFVFSGRKNKSRQKEYVEQIDAIRPGNKVKSAGGLCGVVVEVCDDNTVIIETGSETTGKSYFKLAKESIYQTDAKGPTQIAREQAEAQKLAQKAGAEPAETPAAEPSEEPMEEFADRPAEQPEAPAEEPAETPGENTDGEEE